MKKIIMIYLVTILFLSFNIDVEAANSKKYYNVDDKDYYIVIDKDKKLSSNGKNIYSIESYNLPEDWQEKIKETMGYIISLPQKLLTNLFKSNDNSVSFVSDTIEEGKWWSSVYVCREVAFQWWDIYNITENISIAIYTDSLVSEIANTNGLSWYEIIGGEGARCATYRVEDSVKEEDKVYSCPIYDDLKKQIQTYNGKYYSNLDKLKESFSKLKDNEKVPYINQYNNYLYQIKSACKQALANATYSDGCVHACLKLTDDTKKWNNVYNPSANDVGKCGLSANIINWIKNILKWIKYILPALVIILGILDFIKAIASGSDDEMKKAQGRFIKRLIAAALLFIIPAIIEFVLTIFKIESTFCGIIGK